jgi:TRAP-type C4-dicarboxylate transport system permease small subunit
MSTFLRYLEKALETVSGLLFLNVFLFTLVNIISRNLGGVAIRWLPGVIRMSIIWSVLLATAVLYRRDDHLMVDYFLGKMGSRTRLWVQRITDILTIPFFTLVIIHGWRISIVRMRISFETWRFPTGYAYMALPVAAAVMLLINIERLLKRKEQTHE